MADDFETSIAPIKTFLLTILKSCSTTTPYNLTRLLDTPKDPIFDTSTPPSIYYPPSLFRLPTRSLQTPYLLSLLSSYEPHLTPPSTTAFHRLLVPSWLDSNPLTSAFSSLSPAHKACFKDWLDPTGFKKHRYYFAWESSHCRKPAPSYITSLHDRLLESHLAAMRIMFADDTIQLQNYFFLATSPEGAVSRRFFQTIVVFERILQTWRLFSSGREIPEVEVEVPRREYDLTRWWAMGGEEREYWVCTAVLEGVGARRVQGMEEGERDVVRRVMELVKLRREAVLQRLVDGEREVGEVGDELQALIDAVGNADLEEEEEESGERSVEASETEGDGEESVSDTTAETEELETGDGVLKSQE